MYRPMLLSGLMALSLSATQAQAEEPYPAASFEPKVLYQPEPQAPTQAVEYPAASFTPQVIFQDPKLIEATKAAALSAQGAPIQAAETSLAKEPRTSQPSGAVSDVTPPYAALGLAAAAIALAFWWSNRRERPKEIEPNPTQSQGSEPSQEAQEAEEQDLEELALEVEQTLATTNRQRAGKTKRTRRR